MKVAGVTSEAHDHLKSGWWREFPHPTHFTAKNMLSCLYCGQLIGYRYYGTFYGPDYRLESERCRQANGGAKAKVILPRPTAKHSLLRAVLAARGEDPWRGEGWTPYVPADLEATVLRERWEAIATQYSQQVQQHLTEQQTTASVPTCIVHNLPLYHGFQALEQGSVPPDIRLQVYVACPGEGCDERRVYAQKTITFATLPGPTALLQAKVKVTGELYQEATRIHSLHALSGWQVFDESKTAWERHMAHVKPILQGATGVGAGAEGGGESTNG